MIGGRKTRSNKGKKRGPYRPRTGITISKKSINNNLSNVTNNSPVIKPGTISTQTFNTPIKRKRKVRSNKGKVRGPYGPRTGITRSKRKFRGDKNINPSKDNLKNWSGNWNASSN